MMPITEIVADSWQGIEKSFHAGKMAHAYIVEGSGIQAAETFAKRMLQLIFCRRDDAPCQACSSCIAVDERKHVDVLYVEPSSKSRQIIVADVEELIARMNHTSFQGGWKAAVVLHADRLQQAAENKLLKILEEPPSQSLLLLVTDNKQALLPTIKSRCLHVFSKEDESSDLLDIRNAFDIFPPSSGQEAELLTQIIAASLLEVVSIREETVKAELESEIELSKEVLEARLSSDRKLIQESVVTQLLRWLHDLLLVRAGSTQNDIYFIDRIDQLRGIAKKYSSDDILMMLRYIEDLKQRLDTNLPDQHVFEDVFRKMIR
jgi:DNA polymerase-3 subunit delta'